MNLIFDWSGTLADDQRFAWELTNDTLKHFGAATVSFETYRTEFTLPVDSFYSRYCPGIDIEAVDPFFFECYEQRAAEIELFPGARELLGELRAQGHQLFVLTTNATAAIEACLEHLEISPDTFGEVCGHAFDKRQHLPKLIARHGLQRSQTLFFGDTVHDVETGHASGVRTGALTLGYTAAEALAGAGPTVVLHDLKGVLNYVESLVHNRPRVTVGGLVLDSRGRGLFVQSDKWSKTWGTPGGHVEAGEPLSLAFRREVLEETGLTVSTPRLALVDEAINPPEFERPAHFLLVSFVAKISGSEQVRLNEELLDHRFLTPAEAATTLGLNQPTRKLITHLVENPALLG